MSEQEDRELERQAQDEMLEDFDKFRFLVRLHHDIWDVDLLGLLFKREWRLLEPKERMVLELKVEGKKNLEIARLMRIKLHTVRCRIRDIRFKYRNGVKERVDNMPILRKLKQLKGGK